MAITKFSDSDYNALFKTVYGEYGDNLYATGAFDPLEGMVKKYFDFEGNDMKMAVKVGFGGGTGFETLPIANRSKNVQPTITRKRAYARMMLDRETIVASRGKKGAFIEATKEETMGKIKNFVRTQVMALYNDGTNIIGQFTGPATGTAAAPVVTALATGSYKFRPFYFEEGDYVQVQGYNSTWEITAVNTSTRAITLALRVGSDDLTIAAGTLAIYLQGGANVAPMGLKGAVEFAAGNFHGVAYQRRWSAYYNDEAGKAIDADVLNHGMITIATRSGETPDLIVFSTTQMEKYLNQLEDMKRYPVGSIQSKSNKMTSAVVSFKGIEYVGPNGDAMIVASRFVEDDRIYYVNTKKIERHHAEKFGWFDDDGTTLLRLENDDAYEARYGGYYENFINPLYHGASYNLDT